MIKIKIKYTNGNEVSLEIPIDQEGAVSQPELKSAVAPLAEEQRAFLEAASAVSKDLLGRATTSLSVCDSSTQNAAAKEGEVEEGVVGGVGEEEGEEEREEGEEPNELHLFKFKCKHDLDYTPSKELCSAFVSAFGEELVWSVFKKARAWTLANPKLRKTQKGMGRCLNTWLCGDSGRRRVSIREAVRNQGLLNSGNKDSKGW